LDNEEIDPFDAFLAKRQIKLSLKAEECENSSFASAKT
jgi:hypothetical protein